MTTDTRKRLEAICHRMNLPRHLIDLPDLNEQIYCAKGMNLYPQHLHPREIAEINLKMDCICEGQLFRVRYIAGFSTMSAFGKLDDAYYVALICAPTLNRSGCLVSDLMEWIEWTEIREYRRLRQL